MKIKSGSVFGPLIVSELLARKENVVSVVIGSHESVITAQNTLNTIKSLESISKRAGAPVVMYYEHNDRKRSDVDSSVHLAIKALSILASGKNRELDSKDLNNWLHFNRTTSVEPQLANLNIFGTLDTVEQVSDPISVASIYKDENMDHAKIIPEYSCVGYSNVAIGDYDQLHFPISIDILPKIVSDLKETLGRYETQKNARTQRASVLDKDDNVTDNGLVL